MASGQTRADGHLQGWRATWGPWKMCKQHGAHGRERGDILQGTKAHKSPLGFKPPSKSHTRAHSAGWFYPGTAMKEIPAPLPSTHF